MLFSFTVHLDREDIDKLVRPRGPLFHRWLPDGRKDSLFIPVADERNQIEVWFERRGHSDGRFIKYDGTRKEVDPEIMIRQGHLDAGQLWGECRFAPISDSERDAICDDRVGSQDYIAVGKRLIEFLRSPLSGFIDHLRCQYGQYWLQELPIWDSRTQSLGSYCATTLWLKWRSTEEEEWKDFLPTTISQTTIVQRLPNRAFGEYLTQKDWGNIQQSFKPTNDDQLTLRLIGRAHELRELGHEKEAFIQGTTAVELAVDHFLRVRSKTRGLEVKKAMEGFSSLSLKNQISFLAATVPLMSDEELSDVLEAIDLRNEIVHEGKSPCDPNRRFLLALLSCAGKLLGLTELKTPVLYSGNVCSPPEYGESETLVAGAITIRPKDGSE